MLKFILEYQIVFYEFILKISRYLMYIIKTIYLYFNNLIFIFQI